MPLLLRQLLFESKYIDLSKAAIELDLIGTGNDRNVYQYESGKVLKVAKGQFGTRANFNEIKESKCLGSKYAAQVFEFDESNKKRPTWIISEHISVNTKNNRDKLIEVLEIPNEDVEYYFRSIGNLFVYFPWALKLEIENSKDAISTEVRQLRKYLNTSWAVELIEKLKGCKADPSDFHVNNWGIRESTGEFVLVDLGIERHKTPRLVEARDINTSIHALGGMKSVGMGQTRTVYEYDNDSVLKVAMNNEGFQANLKEIQQYECLTSKYAAKIIDYDKKNLDQVKWIIMEKVVTNKEDILSALYNNIPALEKQAKLSFGIGDTGFRAFDILAEILLREIGKSNYGSYYSKEIENILNKKATNWLKDLLSKIRNCEVNPEDFHINNWGIRESTGELVLLDYGF